MRYSHDYWMHKAIEQAKLGDSPFGAILVKSPQEFVAAYNTTGKDGPHAHAEMNVIQHVRQLRPYASKNLKLYSTVEPCPMCMSALVWAGIGHLIYGASINDAAQFGHQIHISSQEIANIAWYPIEITQEMNRKACLNLF